MTSPTIKVQVAFDDGPLEADPSTWYDITQYVRAGSFRQGRDNELDQASAGVLNLTLDNRSRTFDPFYTSGPYYGKLKARKQIRLYAVWDETDYIMFRGLVAGWPVSPSVDRDSVCQIEAYDLLSYLSEFNLPPDKVLYLINLYIDQASDNGWIDNTLTSGSFWYPLGNNGRQCADMARYGTKTTGVDYTFTVDNPQTGEAPSRWMTGSCNTFDGTYGAIGPALRPGASGTYGCTIKFLMRTTTPGTAGKVNPIIASARNSPYGFAIGVDEDGFLAWVQDTPSGADIVATTLPINDGNWHLVQMKIFDVDGVDPANVSIVVDGYSFVTNEDLTNFAGPWDGMQLIGMSVDSSIADPYYTGDLAHLQIAPTLALASSYYDAFRYGHGLQSYLDTDALDIATLAGLLDSGTLYDTYGTFPTIYSGGSLWNSQSALSALQNIATAFDGRLNVRYDGVVILSSSAAYWDSSSATSQSTFADDGSAGSIKFSSIGAITQTDEFVYNKVTVSTADGLTVTLEDTASQADYGVRERTIETTILNVADATTLANQILTRYAEPQLRIKDWTVIVTGQPDVTGELFNRWLGERVTVKITPNGVGTAISQDYYIEQLVHDFTPDRWQITFSGSPALDGWDLEDATLGLLEDTTILG